MWDLEGKNFKNEVILEILNIDIVVKYWVKIVIKRIFDGFFDELKGVVVFRGCV